MAGRLDSASGRGEVVSCLVWGLGLGTERAAVEKKTKWTLDQEQEEEADADLLLALGRMNGRECSRLISDICSAP